MSSTAILDHDKFPKVEIQTINVSSNMNLVLCTVDSPLYAVYVTVPTFVKDNKGLPHTLEHLIFCGSHDYPERGYLDKLATLCQSHGTNAYTTDDHTCYTFTTSSLSGLKEMLPVFLDHVFRPALSEAVVKREVFHCDSNGQGKGVVYCEMGGREWSEQDQLDLALRRGIIEQMKSDSMKVYGWDCGGKTKDLTTLSLEEIRQYHHRYYRPENVVLVIVGGSALKNNANLFTQIAENVKFHDLNSEFNISPSQISLPPSPSSVSLRFPSNDESLGSIGFGWSGPESSDIRTITALHILMRMLKDTSASPLYQWFVERSDPLATDIDYEIKPSHLTMISLIFSGVPAGNVKEDEIDEEDEPEEEHVNYLVPNLIFDELKKCILEWKDNEDYVKQRLQVAMDSIYLKLQESLEDDPHDMVAGYIAAEVVAHKWPFDSSSKSSSIFGTSLVSIPSILDSLRNETLEFWMDLLEKYILVKQPVEVIMIPSREMNQFVKDQEEQQLEGIHREDLSEDHFDDTRQPKLDDIVELNPSSTIEIYCKENIQHVKVSSPIKRLTVLYDIEKLLSPSHYKWIVLLQELLFQSDLILPTDYQVGLFEGISEMSYQELVETLSSKFTTFEASLGFDNDLFSVGYLDSHLIFSLHGSCEVNLEDLQRIVMTIICCTNFSVQRVTEVLENLINQLKNSWSEVSTVLECLQNRSIHQFSQKVAAKRPKNLCRFTSGLDYKISITEQTDFLLNLREQLLENSSMVIQKLEDIREKLRNAPFMVNYGGPDDIVECISNSNSWWKDEYYLPKNGLLEVDEGILKVAPMSDLTSSYMSVSVPINILPRKSDQSYEDSEIKEMFATAVLCQLLSYTEGPLYRRIRGAGLAYGASAVLALWNGLFTLHIDDSADPVNAYLVCRQLFADLYNESINKGVSEILTQQNLQLAKAAQMFQFVSERSTPASLVSMAIRTSLRGLPPIGSDEEARWNVILSELTLEDLRTVAQQIAPRLFDANNSIKQMAVPSSKLEEIKKAFEVIGVPVEVDNFVQQYSDLLQ